MQNKPFRSFAAAVSINHLRFLYRRQCRECHRLRLATLKNRRTVRARQNAHFASNRP